MKRVLHELAALHFVLKVTYFIKPFVVAFCFLYFTINQKRNRDQLLIKLNTYVQYIHLLSPNLNVSRCG